MKLARNVRLSQKALLRHWVRTILALSGTAVGVGAVLVMISIGEAAEREILLRIEALGRNMLVVNAGDAPRTAGRRRTASKVTTLRPTDVRVILDRSPSVARAAPAQDRTLRVKYGTVNTMAKIMGTTGEWAEIRNFRTTSGRFFTPHENQISARVGVIGSEVRDVLFPDSDPIGETIRVGRVPIEVIGVLERKGVSVDGSAREDNQVVVPINTALRRLFNVDYLKMIYVEVAANDRMDRAVAEMTAALRDAHRLEYLGHEDDFVIQNQAVILEAELQAAASFRRMITGLGAVALVVGGVGILAIMLLSVKERTNEVGLRTAVGARRRDIRTQFLVEAMMLGGSGGMVGVLAGIAVAWTVNVMTEWSAVISGPAVAVAFGSALLIGIVFGVIPAQKAAGLDPIESLRAE